MIKATVNTKSRSRRVELVDRLRNCVRSPPDSCLGCEYTEEVRLVENYYSHDVLMCQHPETTGLIVHDYGHHRDENGGIHPACPLFQDRKISDCHKATKVKSSQAHVHKDRDDSFYFAICPYCYATNEINESMMGLNNCGCCDKTFNVD